MFKMTNECIDIRLWADINDEFIPNLDEKEVSHTWDVVAMMKGEREVDADMSVDDNDLSQVEFTAAVSYPLDCVLMD